MSWNIFDLVGLVFDALNLLSSDSPKVEDLNYHESAKSHASPNPPIADFYEDSTLPSSQHLLLHLEWEY